MQSFWCFKLNCTTDMHDAVQFRLWRSIDCSRGKRLHVGRMSRQILKGRAKLVILSILFIVCINEIEGMSKTLSMPIFGNHPFAIGGAHFVAKTSFFFSFLYSVIFFIAAVLVAFLCSSETSALVSWFQYRTIE